MKAKLDLRGLTCPEPVIRTKKAFDDPAVEAVEAMVDDDVCVNNLKRLARSLKASIAVAEGDGSFAVVIERAGASRQTLHQKEHESPAQAAWSEGQAKVGTVIFLSRDRLGEGDPEFSTTLVNLFLQTALDAGHLPRAILMANSGVKLMAKDSPALKVLDDFKSRGTEVLACGLCLEYYGLKDAVPKDQITNMFAICEYLFSADRVLTP